MRFWFIRGFENILYLHIIFNEYANSVHIQENDMFLVIFVALLSVFQKWFLPLLITFYGKLHTPS